MKGKLSDLRCENEPWPLSKCKRVLRPFASKIRSFHDMAKHYPQILESSQDFGRILQSRTINRQSSSTPPSSNGARYGKGPKNRYTKSQYTIKPRSRTYEDDSDYDSGTEMQDLTFDIDSDRDDGEMVHPIQALDSYHRWKAMKPQVTEEGYQELSEIFELFKRFMSQAYTSDPARLQEHSAMKVGQCVEVTARQSMFDDENEAERDPSNHFNEADWYEHSPAMKLYTKWILLGQGLEILNSHVSDLYYVFPSLIHYCVEIKALRIAQIMASRYLSEVPSDLFWCYFVQRVGINTLHSPSEGQSSIQRNHFAELLNLAQLGYEETIISHLWNKVDFKLLWNHEPIWDEIKRIAVSQKQQHCTHLLLVVIVKKFFKHLKALNLPQSSSEMDSVHAFLESLIVLWISVFDHRQYNINTLLFKLMHQCLPRFRLEEYHILLLLVEQSLIKTDRRDLIDDVISRYSETKRRKVFSWVANALSVIAPDHRFLMNLLEPLSQTHAMLSYEITKTCHRNGGRDAETFSPVRGFKEQLMSPGYQVISGDEKCLVSLNSPSVDYYSEGVSEGDKSRDALEGVPDSRWSTANRVKSYCQVSVENLLEHGRRRRRVSSGPEPYRGIRRSGSRGTSPDMRVPDDSFVSMRKRRRVPNQKSVLAVPENRRIRPSLGGLI